MDSVLRENNGYERMVAAKGTTSEPVIQALKGDAREKLHCVIRGGGLEDKVYEEVKVVRQVVKPEVNPEVLSEKLLENVKADLRYLYNWAWQDLDGQDESVVGFKELDMSYGFYKEMLYLIGEHFSKDLKFIKSLDLYSKDLINEMPGGVYFSDGSVLQEIVDEYSGEITCLKLLLAELFVIDRERQIKEVLRYLKVLPKGYVNSREIFYDLVEYCFDGDVRSHPMLAKALGYEVPRVYVYRD